MKLGIAAGSVLAAALASFGSMAPLAAQGYPPPSPYSSRYDGGYRFELTPTVSYRFGGELDGGEDAFFDTDLEVDESVAYGVTLDFPLSSNLQLELLANRQSSELQFDEDLFGSETGIADIDVSYYHVGLLWQGRHPRITPFFVASLGVANLDPDVPGASSEDRFSASLGGGVKIFLSENVGLRFEGRGFVSDYDSDDRNNNRCDYHDDYDDSCYDDSFSQGQVSVGLIFAW
jgi:opacity protein-like surface antigen